MNVKRFMQYLNNGKNRKSDLGSQFEDNEFARANKTMSNEKEKEINSVEKFRNDKEGW